MPFYQIYHSYPLDASQKSQLAQAITKLHGRRLTTPSLFVNCVFQACNASDSNYFLAGKPRILAANRILALVREGGSRKKSDFDELAREIEAAWYEAVLGPVEQEGKNKGKRRLEVEKNLTDSQRAATKLLFVVFHPMIAARENGMTLPDVGSEKTWLKDNMDYFKEQADVKGNEDFKAMLKEVEEREDLKKWVS